MQNWVWVIVIFGILLLLLAAVVFIAYAGYRRLKVSFASIRIIPEFRITGKSMLWAVVGVLTRNFTGAAGEFIKGIKISGRIYIVNSWRVPLYFPASRHELKIEGKAYQEAFEFAPFWLKAGASRCFPVCVELGKEHIPPLALELLRKGGKLNIEIRSTATLGPFKYARTTKMTPGLRNKTLQNKTGEVGVKKGTPAIKDLQAGDVLRIR